MNFQTGPFLLAASLAASSPVVTTARAETPETGQEIIFGCQGEGCGCTGDSKTSKPFKLHKKMDEQSAVVGEYKEPVNALAGDAFSLVTEPGQHKITTVRKPVGGLKVGSVVDRLFHHGEGFWQASFNGKKVQFQEAVDVSWKTIKPTKFETWYQVTVQGQPGYSRTFPFKACFD